MMMNMLQIALLLLGLLGICYVFCGYTEGFANYALASAGKYPCSVDTVLLHDTYSTKTPPGLAATTYAQSAKSESYTDMSSYAQVTNNVKTWETPDNGTCSTADFCGGVYDKKVFDIKPFAKAGLYDNVRVNTYVGSK